jgi:NAD-dependent dihydropyrimidine dehydrogenase PreA subunit
MIIKKDICVGCGRCQPYCPAGAIFFEDLKSKVDQEKCYECGTCLRVGICPVDALEDHPNVYDYPRALRKYFSDPVAVHKATGIAGRGTQESKSNDVTQRVRPGDIGIAIEVGRPTLGMGVEDIQKITRALAKAGIKEIEAENPIHSLISNPRTGDLKRELLGERVLSAIIEIGVKQDRLRHVLSTVRKVAQEVDSVFCLDVFMTLEPNLTLPREVLDGIEAEGFSWRPNAKINMGLGRPGDRTAI